jgi:biotin carboxyl carrier protein
MSLTNKSANMDIENPEPEYKTFNFEDGDYKTTFTKKFVNRKMYVVPDPKMVFAFIPGTIVKIYVKEKHRVKKGDPLLTFQAMKMNNILTAPIDGHIKKIYVKKGESFPKSQMLVEFS